MTCNIRHPVHLRHLAQVSVGGLFGVAVCCSELQCVAVCCSVLQCVLQFVTVCDAVCLAVWSSLLEVPIGGLFGVIQVSFVGLFWPVTWALAARAVPSKHMKTKPTLTLQNTKKNLHLHFYSPHCVFLWIYVGLFCQKWKETYIHTSTGPHCVLLWIYIGLFSKIWKETYIHTSTLQSTLYVSVRFFFWKQYLSSGGTSYKNNLWKETYTDTFIDLYCRSLWIYIGLFCKTGKETCMGSSLLQVFVNSYRFLFAK